MAFQRVTLTIPWEDSKTRKPKIKRFESLVEELKALFVDDDGVNVGGCSVSYSDENDIRISRGADADADELFAIAAPVLSTNKLALEGSVIKIYGDRIDSPFVRLKWNGQKWEEIESKGKKPRPKKKKKLTLKDARKLLTSNRSDFRENGLKILIERDRRDEAVKYAMKESDSGLVGKAVEWLYPAPAELVVRDATMVQGGVASLGFRYGVARQNYIYAHDALADAYRAKKNKLHPEIIAAAGLAHCQSFAPFLEAYLDCEVKTLEVAIIDEGRREGRRGEIGELDEIWSRETQCGINAAVALRRMDMPVQPVHVKSLLADLDMMTRCPARTSAEAELRWALFDSGAVKSHSKLLEFILSNPFGGTDGAMADLLTTLLKRGKRTVVNRIAKQVAKDDREYSLVGKEFIYWPLTNYLENLGMQIPMSKEYKQARSQSIAPPPWWTWETKPDRPKKR